MSNERTLLNCTFGWGKTCRLYDDSIEIAGKSYDLRDLTSIHPSYRSVFGVPSARLELSFGLRRLVLRGIADLEAARRMVSHLRSYCSTAPQIAHTRLRFARGRSLARAQAKAWERTNKLPVVLDASSRSASRSTEAPDISQDALAQAQESTFTEEPPTDEPLSLAALPKAPGADASLTPGETLGAFVRLAHNLSTYASPLPTALWQSPHTPRLQPPLHSVHLIPEHQKLDSRSMPVPVVKSSVLPVIHVPVRLQYGECAHYSIGAVLCSDRISDSIRASYPPVDHGLLILTNRRVLYLGKRCQFTLAYTHLWYVSLLHSALALHIQGQFRRVIMEVEHSREWASRIELLSFIARRSRPGSEPPTQTVPALPRLDLTVKRRAIRPRLALDQTLADNPTLPLLTERVESKIVEATTIEIDDPVAQEYADHTTLDLPGEEEADLAPICSSEPIQQVVPQTTASSVQSPEDVPTQELLDRSADVTTLPTQEFASSEDAPTQELSDRSDLTMVPTQEFAPQEDVSTQEFTSEEDEPTQELAALSPEEDAPTQELATLSLEEDMPTQELAALSPEEDMPTQELASLPPEEDTPTQKIRCQTAKVRVNMRISAFLDENDDRTIHLRERRLSQARTLSQRGRTTNKLSALTASPRASRRRR